MTFAQFQSTRRAVSDLGAVINDEMLAGSPGLLYCNVLYIEDTTHWTDDAPGKGHGRWYTLIGRAEYQSDDLTTIEQRLYEFAQSEGYSN